MLFRQTLDIEQQQIASIIDTRAVMFAHQSTTLATASTFITWRKNTQRGLCAASLVGQLVQLLDRIFAWHDTHLHPIERRGLRIGKEKILVTTMRIEVLQLRSPSTRHVAQHQIGIECRIRALHTAAHKHLTHQRIDKRRMDSVATIVAHIGCTHRPRSNAIQTLGYGLEDAHRLLFEHTRQTTCREGDLQIVATRRSV